MSVEPFGRLDADAELRERLLPFCRLKPGEVWQDSIRGHRVGVLDATSQSDVLKLFGAEKATLAIQDPPYNVVVGNENTGNLFKMNLSEYMSFSQKWVENTAKQIRTHSRWKCVG